MIPKINLESTGQNITKLHKQAGLAVKDLQNIFGLGTPNAIYKWKRGECLPTIDNLVILASVLNVSIEDILIFDDSKDTKVGA